MASPQCVCVCVTNPLLLILQEFLKQPLKYFCLTTKGFGTQPHPDISRSMVFFFWTLEKILQIDHVGCPNHLVCRWLNLQDKGDWVSRKLVVGHASERECAVFQKRVKSNSFLELYWEHPLKYHQPRKTHFGRPFKNAIRVKLWKFLKCTHLLMHPISRSTQSQKYLNNLQVD
jgi:hypothetical protein